MSDEADRGRRAPLLVTGAPRTGTTWVGRMLGHSGEVAELYEPFNPRSRQARWFDPPHHYLHVDESNEAPYAPRVAALAALRYPVVARLREADSRADMGRALRTWRLVTAHRRAGRRVLVKDPMALFSAPWLAGRFGFRPVVTIRHPCGFVSSVLRVGWTINFDSWLRQERLMASILRPWRADIEHAAAHQGDPLVDAAVFWRICAGVIAAYQDDHPDWIVVRHEDLAQDPVPAFRDLYRALGLVWSDAVGERIVVDSDHRNPADATGTAQHQLARDSRAVADVWRHRLAPGQIESVKLLTADVGSRFYDDLCPV